MLFALSLAGRGSSPDRSTESTRSASANRRTTVCKRWVSGSLSLPSRGPFHLSLTVLILYRSLGSIQACGVVPARSDRVSRVPPYSGYRSADSPFAYGALALCGPPSQDGSARIVSHKCGPNPGRRAPRFGLMPVRSPLLGQSMFLSLPPAT